MHKHRLVIESVHHFTKGSKIFRSRTFEIHRDMNIRHAEASNDTPFVCQGVVRGREREIDHHLKTGLANDLELPLRWLPGSADSVTNGAESVNLGQPWRRNFHLTNNKRTLSTNTLAKARSERNRQFGWDCILHN